MANVCPQCGAALLNGATSCTFCGAEIPVEQTNMVYGQTNGYGQNQYNQTTDYGQNQYNQTTGYGQNQYNQTTGYGQNQYNQTTGYGQNQYNQTTGYAQPPYGQGQQGVQVNVYNQMPGSSVRMKTDRSMVLTILLSLITFGIYGIYFWCVLGSDVNMICARRDGKRQMHYLVAMILLSTITLGIVPLVWYTTLSERVGEEARSRGISTTFGGGSFWLWNVLGTFILIGPFVYLHKLCDTMNQVCEDYNRKGY